MSLQGNLASLTASNAIFRGANSNDVALYTLAGQSVWIGNQMSSNSVCVTSNNGTVINGNLNIIGNTTLSNLTVTGTVTGISAGGGVSSNQSFSNVTTLSFSASSNAIVSQNTPITLISQNLSSYSGTTVGNTISMPYTFSSTLSSALYTNAYLGGYIRPFANAQFITFDFGTLMNNISLTFSFSFTANFQVSSSPDNSTWTDLSCPAFSTNTYLTSCVFTGTTPGRYIKCSISGGTLLNTTLTTTMSITPGIVNQTLNINGPSGYLLDLTQDNARKLTTTTWTTGSDERVKVNIEDANTSICYSNVKSLKLKRFAWDSNLYPSISDRTMLGWIAQDVKTVLPRSITYTNSYGYNDFHNLDTDQVIKSMYGALQQVMVTLERCCLALSNANIPY